MFAGDRPAIVEVRVRITRIEVERTVKLNKGLRAAAEVARLLAQRRGIKLDGPNPAWPFRYRDQRNTVTIRQLVGYDARNAGVPLVALKELPATFLEEEARRIDAFLTGASPFPVRE
jgi:hypothetical protein